MKVLVSLALNLTLCLCIVGCGRQESELARRQRGDVEDSSSFAERLTPEELERLLGDQIGHWTSKGQIKLADGGALDVVHRSEVRWQEKGRSLRFEFRCVKPATVSATGIWEYDESRDAFLYTYQEENGPEFVMIFDRYDRVAHAFHGRQITPEVTARDRSEQSWERLGPNRYKWTMKIFQKNQISRTFDVTSTRVQ